MMRKAERGGHRDLAVLAALGRVFVAGLAVVSVGACALAQDADPTGLLGGGDRASQPLNVDAPEDEGATYPNLASVGEAPPRRPSGRAARQRLRADLASDRANARYSDADLRAGAAGEGEARTTSASGSNEAPEPPDIAATLLDSGNGRSARSSRTAPEGSAAATRKTAERIREGGSTRTASIDGDATTAAARGRERDPDVPRLRPSRRGEPVRMIRSARDGAHAPPDRSPRRRQVAQGTTTVGAADTAGVRTGGGGPSAVQAGQRVAVVYFRHGSHRLVARDRRVLRRVAELYRERGGRLRVVGHASSRTATLDPIAHRMANLDISLKRAEAVADALVAMDVERADIRVEARANREPVYHEFMPTGEAGNRRAEVYLVR